MNAAFEKNGKSDLAELGGREEEGGGGGEKRFDFRDLASKRRKGKRKGGERGATLLLA